MIGQIIFILIVAGALFWFTKNVRRISKNIARGRPKLINDRKNDRLITMLRVAFGQTKLLVRPVPGILHFLVYAGFILINIEILEIVIDGIFGTHRVFAPILGGIYDYMIAFFEILAILVWLSCLIFLIRRNILKLKRFSGIEMKNWPKEDANIIDRRNLADDGLPDYECSRSAASGIGAAALFSRRFISRKFRLCKPFAIGRFKP